MNPLDIVREKLEACLIYSAYAPQDVRQLAGIRLQSQVWIDVPAWYFWLHGVPGAFMLEAFAAHTWEHEDNTFDSGRFVVRFFPPADSPLMAHFSEKEQCLRNSPIFDATGTPVFEQLRAIRTGCFECAVLECHFSRREGDVMMLLRTRSDRTDAGELDPYDKALYLSLARMSALYYRSVPKHSLFFNPDGPDTAMHAMVFSRSLPEYGQPALRHYLALDAGTAFIRQPDRENAWHRLATIQPEAMLSPGCGCCGSH